MDKGIVSLEEKICQCCGHKYDTNAILFQNRNIDNPKLERKTLTGLGTCDTCQSKLDDGYIALVGVKNTVNKSTLKQEEAERTGDLIHIKRTVFNKMFNTDVGDLPMVFVDLEVIEILKNMANGSKD